MPEKWKENELLVEECVSIPGRLGREDLYRLIELCDKYIPKHDGMIAEVGVYCGRSTHIFQRFGTVLAVDNTFNDAELTLGLPRRGYFESARDKYGWNVISSELESTQSAKAASDRGTKFKAIFIDANHDYQSVRNDIDAWLPLLEEGGFIFGDDYLEEFSGVKQAVNETFGDRVKTTHHQKIWYIKND